MSAKRGLGKGFDALIPTDLFDESFDPTAAQDNKVSDMRLISLNDIAPDPDQPRRFFGPDELMELANSITEHGVLQPIVVAPGNDSGYIIVAGERRYRAAKLARLDKIPAIVRTLSDQHKLEISLIENLQRQDLNVIETATAYIKLRDQFNMSYEDIGKRVGKSNSAVNNTMRLLKLPTIIKESLMDGSVTEAQVRPLINVDPEVAISLLARIVGEGWTSRRVELAVAALRRGSTVKEVTTSVHERQYHMHAVKIGKMLDTDVDVKTNTRGAGKITIKFTSTKEFERITQLLEM